MEKITIIKEDIELWFAYVDNDETKFGRGSNPYEALTALAKAIFHIK